MKLLFQTNKVNPYLEGLLTVRMTRYVHGLDSSAKVGIHMLRFEEAPNFGYSAKDRTRINFKLIDATITALITVALGSRLVGFGGVGSSGAAGASSSLSTCMCLFYQKLHWSLLMHYFPKQFSLKFNIHNNEHPLLVRI